MQFINIKEVSSTELENNLPNHFNNMEVIVLMVYFNEQMKIFSDGDKYNDLYHLFARARYLTFRAREKELQRYDLSPERVQLIFLVQALGNKATPAEIARLLVRQPHTVSAMVERMAKKGFVKKVKDLDRKNLVRVVLTEKGKKSYTLSIKRGPIHRILGTLDEKEQKQFQKYLERIMVKAEEELGMRGEDLPSSDYEAAVSD